jgi:hypothetical protein
MAAGGGASTPANGVPSARGDSRAFFALGALPPLLLSMEDSLVSLCTFRVGGSKEAGGPVFRDAREFCVINGPLLGGSIVLTFGLRGLAWARAAGAGPRCNVGMSTAGARC